MGKKYRRRVSELIQINLTDLLGTKVNDPRLQGVTVTGVEVTPDTMRADVYVTALGDLEAREEIMAGLQSAAGWLRREVGARLRLRHTPELVFHWDPSLEYGERIDQLLSQIEATSPSTEAEADEDIGDDVPPVE
ncbi:MAG: 30S ribosome-binding factor RbfA [Chloroflexi bacterium]|nr:MAG: 30S ribosome-binding factor RbfA [Chloroflexota bacterium]